MAKLEISLAKDAFEALDETVKQFYTPNKDGQYELEGIGSIQRALAAEKAGAADAAKAAAAKAVAEALKAFEGIDPDKARAAMTAAEKAEHDRLKESGDFEAIKQQYEERIKTETGKIQDQLDKAASEKEQILATLKREKLANALIEKSVLPARAKHLVNLLQDQMELVPGENGFSIKKKGGIGDATEFDLMIEGLKASPETDFFFQSTSASGSGASGSDGKGGSVVKRLTKAQVAALDAGAKREFYLNGGEVTDRI